MSDWLATLAADPDRVESVSPDELPRLIGECEALRAALWARLRSVPTAAQAIPESDGPEEPDQLLKASEVADRLGVNRRYVYRHADDWPFTIRLSSGTLRFSEKGLTRWQARRRAA